MRKQIAAANWKMNLTLQEANELLDSIAEKNIQLSEDQIAVFAVPFPYLLLANDKLKNSKGYLVAAQNCFTKESGAYTGEVSAPMLASCNVGYVIIGHSERREYFNENNFTLSQKVDVCLSNNLKPIFCCGESLAIREGGTQNGYVETQLKESIFHLEASQIENFVIAYEPIWAIGTGKTASADQAQEMHAHIRNVFAEKYGNEVANSISILYGGSVKANNAKEIFGKPDVDGGLVGGASLNASEFGLIIQSLKN
ncbi:MAG: triose-phosphate isomerase [Bacteroidota bacterium]|nr:triose-phosphate isomerase [Bacteroidota bacterium]